MMSLRTIARSAPRALSRVSSVATRCQVAGRTTLLQSTRTSTVLRAQQVSAFSTTLFRRASENDIEDELSQKLAQEIQFEQDVKDTEPLASSIKDFLESGVFEVKDVPGQEDVVLTRSYNNEKITVTFSIADIQQQMDESELYDEDAALGDEMEGKNEQDSAEAEEDMMEDASVPCRLNVVVEKPGQGALSVEAIAQDGAIVVENLYYYKDAKLAHAASPEAAHAAQDIYPGPPFGTLDEDLQVLMERYLEERGIDTALALFVPDYMEMKEQKEYFSWLNNIKSFVDTA